MALPDPTPTPKDSGSGEDGELDNILDTVWKDGASLAGGSYLEGADPNAVADALAAISAYTQRQVLEGRLIELDLLEQAINAGTKDMNLYKLHRLKKLTQQLNDITEEKK